MQSVHASARTLSHTNLIYRPDASLASNTDVSTRSPPLICPSFQRAHVPRVLKRLGTSARQVASSDWVCKSCSNRFLAGAQKVWDEGQKLRAGGQNAKKGKRGVTAQWFHFNSRKSLNVSLQEGIPGVDEYLRDTERIVHIAFPDRRRLQYRGDGLWRATLKPVTFFTISATPVTDVRTWYEGGALQIASNRVVLDLAGLPPQFHNIDLRLNLRGSLTRVKTSPRVSSNCAMDGSVDLGVGVDLPAPLSFIPAPAVNAVGTAILEGILIAMESALRRGLVEDYRKWCIEKRNKIGEARQEQGVQAR